MLKVISKLPKVLLAGALVVSTGVAVGADTFEASPIVESAYAETTLACNTPSQDEIKQAWKEANIDWYEQPVYSTNPVLTEPYGPGVLNQTSLENGLKALNLIRYIAGVDPVNLDATLCQQSQAGALIQSINGGYLNHSPERPLGMNDSLYALAQEGSLGNLAITSSLTAVSKELINDLGSSTVGHRRDLLRSNISSVGLGIVGNYAVIKSNVTESNNSPHHTIWPAQNMPIELYSQGTNWSFAGSINNTTSANIQNVLVTVTNLANNNVKYLSYNDLSVAKLTSSSGLIVFNPNLNPEEVKSGASFQVDIEGLGDNSISYTVNFFNATDSYAEPTPEEPSVPSVPDTPNTPNPPSSSTTTPTDKPASVVNASWVKSGSKWWYRYGNGGYPANQWELIANKWYHFDASGWMQTGWLKLGSTWYYLNANGDMAVGWKKVGNTWYYLSPSGAMKTGWQYIDGAWYYLNGSGAMLTGWYKVGNTWYYSNASGVMQSNKWIGNYYVGASGAMATNTWIGNYHVNASGLWDKTA